MKTAQQGFTLIELMIVVAIVAILAGVGMPAYQNYVKKAEFSEVIGATAAYKTAVELCINIENSKDNCDAGNKSIPAKFSPASGASGTITEIDVLNGKITAKSNIGGSASDATYTLEPKIENGLISWTDNCSSSDYC